MVHDELEVIEDCRGEVLAFINGKAQGCFSRDRDSKPASAIKTSYIYHEDGNISRLTIGDGTEGYRYNERNELTERVRAGNCKDQQQSISKRYWCFNIFNFTLLKEIMLLIIWCNNITPS